MAGINALPTYDATATIGGGVGRKLNEGFGGTTSILARDHTPTADFYGLHPNEIIRQPPVAPLGAAPRADYGLKTPANLVGLPIYTGPLLAARLPRSGSV